MRRDTGQLAADVYDIAVVGAGMQGAWLALRAAEAGLRVALIERDDFGAATSANSLSILHGGLRYLQHLDFVRMRSSIRARREFCRRSPHLVRPLRCLMPLRAMGVRSPWVLGPALLANDWISADRNQGVAAEARLPSGSLLSAQACRESLAPLAPSAAFAGAVWWDVLALDAARLLLEAVAAAAQAGATVANRVEALQYLVHDHAVHGVLARDCMTGRTFELRATVVVNAAGPWAGQMSRASGLHTDYLPAGWLGGMNLVLRRSLGADCAIALSAASKGADRTAVVRRTTRELFFVPWGGVTMVGTDYLPVGDPYRAADAPPESAAANFLAEVAAVAPRANLSADDVAMVHWGLLPSDDPDSGTPRKAPIVAAGRAATGAAGLVVVIGEKLTSAPILSGSLLELARRELGNAGAPRQSALRGARDGASGGRVEDGVAGLAPEVVARLTSRYGRQWTEAGRLAERQPELAGRIEPQHEVLAVEIVHAIRHEMATSLEDVVLRRLGLGNGGHPGVAFIERCATIAASEFGWVAEDVQRAVDSLDNWYRRHRPRHALGPGATP